MIRINPDKEMSELNNTEFSSDRDNQFVKHCLHLRETRQMMEKSRVPERQILRVLHPQLWYK